MIKRPEYLDTLIRFKDKDLIKVVTGIRRCGKSTLFDLYCDYLKEQGIEEEQIIKINLEDRNYSELDDYIKLYDYIFESSVEREFVNTFKCVARAEDITVDEDEISEGRFFSFEEIESLLGSGKLTPNFEIEYSKLKRDLKLR